MPFYLKNLALMALLVALGSALAYLLLRLSLLRRVDKRTLELEHRINVLTAELRALEARIEEQAEVAGMQAAAAPEFLMQSGVESAAAPELVAVEQLEPAEESQVSPEMMAILAVAVTAFLGKKARILSARLLESPHELVNAWSQQGRVFVQASHNLRARG